MPSDLSRPADIPPSRSASGGLLGTQAQAKEKVKPSIPHALAVAENDLTHLVELAKLLSERLTPVMQKSPDREGRGAGTESSCEVADRITSVAVGMRFASWTLQDVLDRLEL